MLLFPVFLVAVVALLLVAAAPNCWAEDDEGEIPFDVAELFFELNNTDGDLGIHALIDGEPWKKLEIEGPRGRELLNIYVQGRLRRQGLTELFFESAEPTFDELSPEDFFRRFREGEYEIEGRTLEGDELESTAELTHVMPAPPGLQEDEETIIIELNSVPDTVIREKCDDEDPAYDPTPVVPDEDGNVVVSWPAVETSHPEIGRGGVDVEINNYEVVVEVETEDEFTSVFSIILPPNVTEVTIPEYFLDLGDEFKYEVLAREESFNQTAVESCFEIAD
jgi:hypothetical protein